MAHLFEFMDIEWLPISLRNCLRDILECGNGFPFRTYYQWVVEETIKVAGSNDTQRIVELGCGTAPITQRLIKHPKVSDHVTLSPCDLNPDTALLTELAKSSNGRIRPTLHSIDFSTPRVWPEKSLLILSATFHHIPPLARVEVLKSLLSSDSPVIIFEPLKRTSSSILFVFGSLVPAFITPIRFIDKPHRFRRFLWCWLIPVAPLMFLWDGIVSCLRQWARSEWSDAATKLECDFSFRDSLFSYMVMLQPRTVLEPTLPLATSEKNSTA